MKRVSSQLTFKTKHKRSRSGSTVASELDTAATVEIGDVHRFLNMGRTDFIQNKLFGIFVNATNMLYLLVTAQCFSIWKTEQIQISSAWNYLQLDKILCNRELHFEGHSD